MGEGELKRRIQINLADDPERPIEHQLTTSRYMFDVMETITRVIDDAKKDFPFKDIAVADYSKAKDFVESKKILLKLQKWYLKWFGDSS